MSKSKPLPKWPANNVEQWPLDRLKPYERNARTHSDAQIAQLMESIREWGWTMPVLATKDGRIIAGHGRVEAARRLGVAAVPVMTAEGWTDAQVRAYTLADNRLALNAVWDGGLLAAELGDLNDLGVDLKMLGFDQKELSDIFGTAAGDGASDPGGIKYQEKFSVLVECTDEPHQAEVYEQLLGLGPTCKVLVN